MRDAEEQPPPPATSAPATLRLIAGWAAVAIAVLDLCMGVDTGPFLLFHAMLLLGGVLLLLGLGRLRRRPGRIAWSAGAAVAVGGLVLSALPATGTTVCCLPDLAVRHGFPFTMLGRGPGGWQLDRWHAVADLVFWALAGLAVLMLSTLLRRPRSIPTAADAPPSRHAAHAEERAARTEATDDENVGGLP